MRIQLTARQKRDQAAFRAFVEAEIVPYAAQFDQEERLPAEIIGKLTAAGYLGALLPETVGGLGMEMITFGLLHEEVGRGCSSVRSLLTVHSMVAYAILRWGSREQKACWLPKLGRGEVIAAFGLSEPAVGSDAKSIQTTAVQQDDGYVLTGQKRWITGGQIAGLFLIFAQCAGKATAFLVERERQGLRTEPIRGLLGTRGSMLAEVHLDHCWVPAGNRLGGVGFGFTAVALSALDVGRYSVACGCVGIGRACLEASLQYSNQRQQFGVYLKDHQLIQQMITNMITNVRAATLLCYEAGYLKETNSSRAAQAVLVAKYFASTMATQAANDAVQIHGANGCSREYPVQRYLRDAKIMEIIEGSTQIQQLLIAGGAY